MCTPMHRAAQKGHNEVVKILINAKANLNCKDKVSCIDTLIFLV